MCNQPQGLVRVTETSSLLMSKYLLAKNMTQENHEIEIICRN